ncbi:MAG: HEPN domain-containing protein [Candidatus Hydrogenedentota bacterium]
MKNNFADKHILYWIDIADYDIKTADKMFKTSRYLYVVFMCQQSIEKILKAIYIQKKSSQPPRIHNLIYLTDILELDLSEDQIDTLENLSKYYIEGRYPTYKVRLSRLVNRNKAESILKSTKELYKCLKSLIK